MVEDDQFKPGPIPGRGSSLYMLQHIPGRDPCLPLMPIPGSFFPDPIHPTGLHAALSAFILS